MAKIAESVQHYINALPEEQHKSFETLRATIVKNIPQGFEEQIQYKMPSYVIPHSLYAKGYHCNPSLPLPFVSIASRKSGLVIHHLGIYASAELLAWFTGEYPKHSTSKLDMGKGCIRFKKMNDIPFDLIAQLMKKITAKEWIALYEMNLMKKK